MANETIFKRYENNPIITADLLPQANGIFNSAVVPYKNGYAGVFRVDTQSLGSELHTGCSKDSITWKLEKEPIQLTGKKVKNIPSGAGYDPRVTEIEGIYYVTWCFYPAGIGPAIGIAKTDDLNKLVEYIKKHSD